MVPLPFTGRRVITSRHLDVDLPRVDEASTSSNLEEYDSNNDEYYMGNRKKYVYLIIFVHMDKYVDK